MVSHEVYVANTRTNLRKSRYVICELYRDLHRIRRVHRKATFTSSTISHSDGSFSDRNPRGSIPIGKILKLHFHNHSLYVIHLTLVNNNQGTLSINWHCTFFHPIFSTIQQDHLGATPRDRCRHKKRRDGKKSPSPRGILLSWKQEHSGGLMPTVSSIPHARGWDDVAIPVPLLHLLFPEAERIRGKESEKKREIEARR